MGKEQQQVAGSHNPPGPGHVPTWSSLAACAWTDSPCTCCDTRSPRSSLPLSMACSAAEHTALSSAPSESLLLVAVLLLLLLLVDVYSVSCAAAARPERPDAAAAAAPAAVENGRGDRRLCKVAAAAAAVAVAAALDGGEARMCASPRCMHCTVAISSILASCCSQLEARQRGGGKLRALCCEFR